MTPFSKRLSAGFLGTAVLAPTLFFSYRVLQTIYYDYFLFPKLKAEDHYIAPTRWQDFAFQAIFWTIALCCGCYSQPFA
jgi:hypothetical protein